MRIRSLLAHAGLVEPAHSQTTRTPSAVIPATVQVGTRHLGLAGGVCGSFAVTGYPAEVSLGWLEPLLTYPGRLDVSLHVEPIPPQVAASRLRHQLARLESARRSDAEHGRLVDFESEAAAEDAYNLAAGLARGQEKLYRAGLYLTVHAAGEEELAAETSRVRALTASMLLDARPATFRSLQGWVTCLPLGVDALRMRRTMDTSALAAAYPFTSPDLTAPTGEGAVLYGANTASSSLVMWDRWALPNHNSVILGSSGGGKSYLAKLETLRSLYTGVQVLVIDPEDEYARLTRALGGALIRLGARDVRLNPFDLPAADRAGADALTRRQLFLHTFIAVLLGETLDPGTRAALDRAVIGTYAAAGISPDPRTWARRPPLLADLAHILGEDGDAKAGELAARLGPYTSGAWRGLFDGPTTTRPEGHLVTFSLRDLPEELKTVGVLLTLDAIWRTVSDPGERRPRLVLVDEGWLLMREAEGARFLFRMAKAARKHWAGLTVVTQDAADVLGSDLGRAVVSNSATQILLRQAPQAADAISDAFALSQGERQYLLTAPRGSGLLAGGAQRVGFTALSSPFEHKLCTSDPAELAELAPDEDDEP